MVCGQNPALREPVCTNMKHGPSRGVTYKKDHAGLGMPVVRGFLYWQDRSCSRHLVRIISSFGQRSLYARRAAGKSSQSAIARKAVACLSTFPV